MRAPIPHPESDQLSERGGCTSRTALDRPGRGAARDGRRQGSAGQHLSEGGHRQNPVGPALDLLGGGNRDALTRGGVDSLADSGVVLKARIKTRPLQQWNVGREYNRRIKLAFDEAGVEIPFPHLQVVLPERQVAELARAPATAS